MGNELYDSLASFGRFGDSEIREIDGAPAHVNIIEAYMLDTMGEAAENEITAMGFTVNPDTGLNEHFWGWLVAAVVGAVLGASQGGGVDTSPHYRYEDPNYLYNYKGPSDMWGAVTDQGPGRGAGHSGLQAGAWDN